MRQSLDILYRVSGGLSAFFLMMIGITILGQIVGRLFGIAFDATEISGFCMAASTFLGLAYTLRAGAHIRVNLLIGRFGPQGRRAVEMWCCALGGIALGYFSINAWMMTYDSLAFGDTSPGLMAVPFWIPQIGMSLGATILTIALFDELAQVLGGKIPEFLDAEAQAIGEELGTAAVGQPASR